MFRRRHVRLDSRACDDRSRDALPLQGHHRHSRQLIQQGGPLAQVVSGAAHAFSGSCALLALYDPTHSVLRLANVGDSRAVLGRWNGTKYVCEPMSVDHTGFNPDEVSRLQREHPGEHGIVDPRSGRVHGLATSRAFGDS